MGGISQGTLTILRSYGFEYISAWRRWQVRIHRIGVATTCEPQWSQLDEMQL
jgi:hypothetical protein